MAIITGPRGCGNRKHYLDGHLDRFMFQRKFSWSRENSRSKSGKIIQENTWKQTSQETLVCQEVPPTVIFKVIYFKYQLTIILSKDT